MDAKSPGHLLVFGLERQMRILSVFSSRAEAAASVEGLEIVEGDWRFFGADGAPLEVRFSTMPRINAQQSTYTNGEYVLEPAKSGASLLEVLAAVDCRDEADSGLTSLRAVEQFLIDQAIARSK